MTKNTFRMVLSAVAVLAVAVVTLYSANAGSNRIFMNGGLSMKHAGLSKSCESCHTSWSRVADNSCMQCHQAARHLSAAGSLQAADFFKDLRCYACHMEHNGREHNLRAVKNSSCCNCHKFNESSQSQHQKESLQYESCVGCHTFHKNPA